MGILRKAGGAFSSILKDPVAFCGNLVGAVRGGCQKFSGNVATHLKNGLTGWLFGALAGSGLTLPAQFDTKGIVSVVLQVLGATYERLRGKLANKIGEQKVGRLEKTFDFLRTIVTGGLGTAWQKISEFAGNLQEMVIGGIKEWVMQSVITSAITKLISMFNPAGAIVQAAMAIYNTVMFFIERGSQIAALAEAVFNSIGSIAAGNVAGAANYVEQTIGRSLPVMISFLARLIGLGGVSEHIKNVIKKIQTPIENAMNKLAIFIVEKGKSLVGKGNNGNNDGKPDERTPQQKQASLDKALGEAEVLLKNKEMSSDEVKERLPAIKSKYKMTALELVVDSKDDTKETVHVHGEINPTGDTDNEEKKITKTIRRKDIWPGTPKIKNNSWDIILYAQIGKSKVDWCLASVSLNEEGKPHDKGPEMYINTHNLEINNEIVNKLKIEGGVSFTQVALDEVNKAYKNTFGNEPPRLSISLADSNRRNFKREFARFKKQNPSSSDDQAAQYAIRHISAGSHRIELGYTNFTITLSDWREENLGDDLGVNRVPDGINVIAKKPSP
jgi:hypothetical protein